MRSLVVVEAQIAIEGVLELRPAREVATAELDAPMLVEDGALEPFDEAVGPGMPWLRARALPLGLVPGWTGVG